MLNFLHTFNPQSTLFKFSFLEIHWYGLLIALGALLGFLTLYYLAKRYGLKKDDIYNLAFYVIVFGLIGDRLYYVIYAWQNYSQNLWDIFKIWEGGLAIHGAMIAGIIVLIIYGKRHKISFWLLLDLVVVSLALAMAIGRWGNYFNQELFGLPTNLPWGIPIQPEFRPANYITAAYFHPTFIYESLYNLGIFISLFCWHILRLKKYKNPEKVQGLGNITLAYFFLYSVGRFMTEFLRTDYSPYVLGIRWAQIMSGMIIIACLIIFGYKLIQYFKIKIKQKKTG
ncbi:MAG: prolipoprotein diacylglyceryl transferase [Candidatus Parcubacteria bacterium]|nr:prolipoprotein diacylglyceryl transferase [Candidatus Parcubacteria bacterium]